jgi:beta-xylosidase
MWDKLPFDAYDDVKHGCGVWAPSIRYHNNKFYALIPFPDEGIFVSETNDIENGTWSEPRLLIKGQGIEDPCPIWVGDKCYLVVGFVKSRIGFNSKLAVFEITKDCKKRLTDYKFIYDGHNTQPTIEGPKFYYINDYIYILAPAGSVKTGWQTALRSKNVYGPYEEKIILMQNDSKTNGPHQGALIDLPDGNYAFMHFQDKGVYGRIVHLEPVTWSDGWPLIGRVNDLSLAGTPVDQNDYLIDKISTYSLQSSDYFKKDKLSYMWQTPAYLKNEWYKLDNGLILNCVYNLESMDSLNLCPNLFLTKINSFSFNVSVKIKLNLINDNDEAGLCFMGKEYAFISAKRINGKNYILLNEGSFNNKDNILEKYEYDSDNVIFNMYFSYPGVYQFGINNKKIKTKFIGYPGRWIGGKYGLFAIGNSNSKGYAKFNDFKVVNKDGK